LSEEKLNELADQYITISKEKVALVEQLIDQELSLFKTRGATNLQLLDAEESLKAIFYGEKSITDSLDLRLRKEREITKEKLAQTKLSGDALTLLKIANDYGIKEAAAVNEILAGRIRLQDVSQATQDIFKRMFTTKFPELEAQEELIRRLEEFVGIQNILPQEKLFAPTITTQIGEINLAIEIPEISREDKTKTAEQIQADIAEAFKNDPKVRQTLEKIIDNRIELH